MAMDERERKEQSLMKREQTTLSDIINKYFYQVQRISRKSLEPKYAADCSPVNDDKYYSNRFSHQVAVMPVKFQINCTYFT